MSRSAMLLDFPEEILCSISEYAGALAQHELFKTGNRLLATKLFNSRYFRYYSNMTEFGTPTYRCESLVKKLRGLKRFVFTFPPLPRLRLPNWSVIQALPSTLEELSVNCPTSPSSGPTAKERIST